MASADFEIPAKARRIGFAVRGLMHLFAFTFRWRLEDPSGIASAPPERPMIWLLWHNRIFTAPKLWRRYLPTRSGAILTSASKDGAIIAALVQGFGIRPIRGSSSRRGAAALLELVRAVRGGEDVAIIPDGPRGPRYQMGPGAIRLAQKTGAAILPIQVNYSSYWEFQSWDRFQLPKPFCRVTVSLQPLVDIPAELTEKEFEEHRLQVQSQLGDVPSPTA